MKTSTTRHLAGVLVLLPVLALLGCGGSGSGPGGQRNAPSSITVLADQTLKEPFTAIGKQFTNDNPGKSVTFTFAPPGTIAQQAAAGKAGDVVATPNPSPMDSTQKVQLSPPRVFATKGSDTYAIATLSQTRNASLSQDFITYVAGPPGQALLQQNGFGAP